MDPAVDDGLVGEVPEIVLDEPEHRVRDHGVVLLVLFRRWRGVVQPRFAAEQRSLPRGAVLVDERPLAVGSSTRHPVGRGHLRERQQRRDDAAGAAREAALGSWFVRGAVGDHDG